jgi:hypothetical protein|tara:strand:- start:936 stop:1163 length:228 start_codon:yes stop_codon:yes gene_type:complete
MKKDRVRINPQSMAKDMAYVKRKLNDILTNDDIPVTGKDIDNLRNNQKNLLKRTERLIWSFSGLLLLEILLHFFL